MSDFDFQADAGLAALGQGLKGFAQGWQDAEDRKMKKLEMDSKMEAQKAERERNQFLDSMTARDKGFKRDPISGQAVPDVAARRGEAITKLGPQGYDVALDDEGNVAGVTLNPEHKKFQIEKATAGAQITAANKPATEGQSSAGGFAKRLEQSEAQLAALLNKGFDPTTKMVALQEGTLGGDSALGRVTEGFKNNDIKQYEQIKRNFITAVLRLESGAAIGKEEYTKEEKKYFPQAGDNADTLAQKAATRMQAFENLKASSGKAYAKIPTAGGGLVKATPLQKAMTPLDAVLPSANAGDQSTKVDPQIKQYADQYGLDYQAAKAIIDKRRAGK